MILTTEMTNLFCFALLGIHSIHDQLLLKQIDVTLMARALQCPRSGVACYVLSVKAKSLLMNIAVNFTDFPFCES